MIAASDGVIRAARQRASRAIRDGFALTGLHRYNNADGSAWCYRIRAKHPDGRKWIRPMHAVDGKFVLGEPAIPDGGKPLYRPPFPAIETDPVFIVEGEACADALAMLGLTAVTSGSASSAPVANWSALRGRPVRLWPDHDTAGTDYADAVERILLDQGCTVSRIDVASLDLPDGGDCIDWLAAHPDATADDVQLLPDLVKIDRDKPGHRDTASDNGLAVPGDPGQNRDSRDKSPTRSPVPYFYVIDDEPEDDAEDAAERQRPGVYYVGLKKWKYHGETIILGHERPAWIASPLYVLALARDPSNGEWGRLLEFPDPDGKLHRWCCPQSMHAGSGDELRAILLREGLQLTTNPEHRRLIGEFIQRERVETRARCVTRTGWHGDAYVLPRQTIGNTSEPVLFQSPTIEDIGLALAGSLDGWRNDVASPCAGNSRLVLALSVAFAAPCAGLLHAEGGGFHLRGPTSCGKSTALAVASSVWGDPAKFRLVWRATDNGLEGVAAMHSDLLLVLDELGQLEPRHAGQVSYMLANGQGKARAHRDGSPRSVTTWRVQFLSAGEIGLSDLVTASGGKTRAGQEVRVIDVPADPGPFGLFEVLPDGIAAGAFSDRLKAAADRHHGHAAIAFIQGLAADTEAARAALRGFQQAIARAITPADATGQVRRVADRFALVGAAGELATAMKLTGWPEGEAARAADACFRAWIASRGGTDDGERVAMLSQVRAFLETHGESRFTRWDAGDEGQRTINRAGYRRQSDDGPTFYIEREAFRREVAAGYHHGAVARVLADAGALVLGSSGEATRKERLPDGRSCRVYVVGPALWGEP